MNYGLYKKMEIYRAKPATKREMTQFHSDDYIEFLSKVTPNNMNQYQKEQAKYTVGDDCPIFDGLFDYCAISAGGSMGAFSFGMKMREKGDQKAYQAVTVVIFMIQRARRA
ncbi:histone deacetylase [Serendipita sp. 401]|nr:histone deacetylase [Serendipita sp. 401]